jgi:hypothetical protein
MSLLSNFGYMYYLKLIPLDRNMFNIPHILIVKTPELL